MSFAEILEAAQKSNTSRLCIGLDPVLEKLPESIRSKPDPLLHFCRNIVEATSDIAGVYKPNIAFFEAYGSDGIRQLEELRKAIPPHIPVLLDAKRGDIGHSSAMYAQFAFKRLNAHAVTVSPYLGRDSLEPFLEYPERCIFVLCVTSNPGARDLQLGNRHPLYKRVIDMCTTLRQLGEVGLVTGATHLEQLQEIRELYTIGPLLVPGLGVQGGDTAQAVKAATKNGQLPAIFNVSRSVLYAGSGSDFANTARAKALEYRDAINRALE